MFEIILKMFIVLLTCWFIIDQHVNVSNHTRCVFLSNQWDSIYS